MTLSFVYCVIFFWIIGFVRASPSISPNFNPVLPTIPLDAFQRDLQALSLGLQRSKENTLQHAPYKRAINGTGIKSVNYEGQSFNVLLSIGQYNFQVALDSASSDSWVVASSCNSPQCNQLPSYPLDVFSPSYTAVNDNSTLFGVSFADGTSATGVLARESLSLATFTVSQQIFGLMHSSDIPLPIQVSGVLGLGFPRLSTILPQIPNALPFISNLAISGQLAYPIFAINLPREGAGSLTLGAVDASIALNISSFQWNRVAPFGTSEGHSNASAYLHWALELTNVTVNGVASPLQPTYGQIRNETLALIDIGVNGIYGPPGDVARIYSQLPDSRLVSDGTWAIPCDTNYTLEFAIGAAKYALRPTDLLIGQAEGNPNMCITWPRALPNNGDGVDWQLGLPFLHSVYTVFSYGIAGREPPMIGFALLPDSRPLQYDMEAVLANSTSASLILPTTLPNYILPTPTHSTPLYIFNSSVPNPSRLVSSGIGNSTYLPLLSRSTFRSLPTVAPSAVATTWTIVDEAGFLHVTASTSYLSEATVTRLGGPQKSSSAVPTRFPCRPSCFHLGFIPILLLVTLSPLCYI